MRWKAFLLIFLTGTLLGSNIVASRFSLGQFHPITFVNLRLLLASVLYISSYIVTTKRRFPRDRKLIQGSLVWGVLTAIQMSAMVLSVQYLSSGVVSLIISVNPVIVLIMAHFLLGDEHMTRLKVAGSLLAFLGVSLILTSGETGLADVSKADWRGYAWIILNLATVPISIIFARRFLSDYDAYDVATVRISSAALMLLPVTLGIDGLNISRVETSGWLVLLYSSIIGTFIAFILDFVAIKRYGASTSSQIGYIIPVSAALLGVLLLDEQLTVIILTGMALIFGGLRLLNHNKKGVTSPSEKAPANQQSSLPRPD